MGRMNPRPSPWLLVLALLTGTVASGFGQDVVISEFLANNVQGLKDDDGTRNDWIELRNTTVAAVNMSGWYLSDDALRKDKWPFPSVSIPAGGTLLVWASEKDRRDPARALHTNFKLSKGGEYLGLYRTGGMGLDVVDEFAPTFPAQFSDVSYGRQQNQAAVTLLANNATIRWKVPTGATEDVNQGTNANTWINANYNDTAWATAAMPIGYGRDASDPYDLLIPAGSDIETSLYNVTSRSCYLRAAFTVANVSQLNAITLKLRADDAFEAWLNGVPAPVAQWNEPSPFSAWNTAPPVEYADTEATSWKTFRLDASHLVSGANVLCVQGYNFAATNNDFLMQAEITATSSDGSVLGTFAYFTVPSPGAVNVNGTASPGPSVAETTKNPPQPVVPSLGGAVADSQTQFSGNQGQSGWNYGYAVYGSGVATNNVYSTGLFTPFDGGAGAGAYKSVYTTPAATAPYNYWTGTLWDLNTASAAPWTTISQLGNHPSDSNPATQTLMSAVRRWTSTVAGNYVLTGYFNRLSTAGDGTVGHLFVDGVEIFSSLTKGDTVSFAKPVTLAVGTKIDSVVDVGPGNDDGTDTTNSLLRVQPAPVTATLLKITSAVARTKRPLASVTLKARFANDPEISLPMSDDGTGADSLANDGIFSANIDVSLALPGQMLRWRVVATDDLGAVSTDPPYPDPLDSPQYFGTVISDPSVATSALPVLHWFTQDAANAGNLIGSRGSIFYNGEFYDNIFVNRHGQSTAGFAKRSHNVGFNKDDDFRWKPGGKRVKAVDLLSNWADKSKIRNAVVWEAYRMAGAEAHDTFPVRVQQNGLFYSIHDMIENAGTDYLKRAGLDENGALYKMYNILNSAATNVEKKSRTSEGNTDLATLVNSLNTGAEPATVAGMNTTLNARRTWGYDNVDLCNLVNYLAVTILTTNNDQGHKNYYLFKDYDKLGTWKLLPWDCDLSLGHTWTGSTIGANPPQIGAAYFDDMIDSQRAIQLGAVNRLKLLCYNAPEINKMLMRRLRTLSDQWLGSGTATTGWFEDRTNYWLDQIDPPGLGNASDAYLDGQKWGIWTMTRSTTLNNSGTTIASTAGTFAATWALHNPRASAGRIIDPNGNPSSTDSATATYPSSLYYPGGTVTYTNTAVTPNTTYSFTYTAQNYPPFGAVQTVHPYLKGRRNFIYSAVPPFSDRDTSGTTTNDRDPLPGTQTATPSISFLSVEFNPGAQGQDAEYFILKNNETSAVDLSGWTISGAIDFTLPGGCVVPAADATSTLPNAANIGQLVVAKKPVAFRARTSGPTGGQSRLIVGGYAGQISARGETLELRNPAGVVVSNYTWAPAPTPAQTSLRVVEVRYAPTAPTPSELAVMPALQASDFEYLVLQNTGAASLNLAGCKFDEGIDFTFGPLTLSPGQTVVLAGNTAAFALRHPAYTGLLAGSFTGDLDNGGEQIHLLDPSGESILEFAYDGAWYWPADDNGYSLVIRDPAAAYTSWDTETSWGISRDGTLGSQAYGPAEITGSLYKIWKRAVFSTTEQADPAISDPNADTDADGLSNLIEYAIHGNPATPDAGPTVGHVLVGADEVATLTFRRQKFAPDLVYHPQISDGLDGWADMTDLASPPVDNGDGTETVTFRAPTGAGTPPRAFTRLRVELILP